MLHRGLGYCIKAQQVAWKVVKVFYFPWSLILFPIDSYVARLLLDSLFIKQGIKYDAPELAVDIASFIVFHG